MSDRPYTDDDLRAEAARQHYILTSQLNGREVLSRMLDARVQSTCAVDAEDGLTWDEALNCGEFDEPKAAVRDLIRGAADTSQWAVNLGADGLQPDEHTIQLGEDPGDGDRPRVRMHFAFHPDMPDADRDHFVMGLSKVVLRNL